VWHKLVLRWIPIINKWGLVTYAVRIYSSW
jgi:hypothetical protein